jgi:nucleotide-binding universal stress UspA family protein
MRPGSDSGGGRNQGLGRRKWRPVLPNAEIGADRQRAPCIQPIETVEGCGTRRLARGVLAAQHLVRERCDTGRTEWSIVMTGQAGNGAIVVGVDGSTSARQALNWAVSEAVATHRPLHIVHCFTGPLMKYPLVTLSSEPPDGGFEAAAQRLLADARKRATSAGPGIVKVTSELVLGAPASALLAQAQDAELLVVGGRGPDGFAGLPERSVGGALAAHASCPLVVVPSTSDCDLRPAAGRIVAGVDRSHLPTEAIRFAFETAARRQAALTTVWVWPSPMWGYPRLVTGIDSVETVERHHLLRSLEAEHRRFPQVQFEVKLVRHHHHVGKALIEESEGAGLLVLGRGRGGLSELLRGSVTHLVLEHAKCPVAVLGRQPATGGGKPAIPPQCHLPRGSRKRRHSDTGGPPRSRQAPAIGHRSPPSP